MPESKNIYEHKGALALLALMAGLATGLARAQEVQQAMPRAEAQETPQASAAGAVAREEKEHVRFEVRSSRMLGELVFLQRLSSKAQANPYRDLFRGSAFDTAENAASLAAFEMIPLDYEYEFHEYPPGTKMEGTVLYQLKRNLVLDGDLSEFRRRSIGLLPLCDLNRLIDVMERLAPAYDALVYEPNRATFEKQLTEIEELVAAKDISQYFDQARVFYRSSWDATIPFLFVFYPQPGGGGFSATAYGNIAESALPTEYTEYTGVLSVMLHESAHILLDEQSLEFKKELEGWFTASPSRYSHFAKALMHEAWATAVGNGYFSSKLTGKLNPGSWYNFKYNDLMAKEIYPLLAAYLDDGAPLDRPLIEEYIAIYEDKFPTWISEWDNLLTGRYVLSEDSADFRLLDQRFPYRNVSKYLHDFSPASFEKLLGTTITKLVVVSGDNSRKLDLIRSHFRDLDDWHPDAEKDFTYAQLLSDRTPLIIVNLVNGSLEDQLASKLVMH